MNGFYGFNDCTNASMAVDWNWPKQPTTNADDLNATLFTPNKQIEQCITPEPTQHQSKSKVSVTQSPLPSPGPSNANISYFDPSAMSTPARPNDGNRKCQETSDQQQQKQSESFDSFDSTLLAAPPPTSLISPACTGGSTTPNSQQLTYSTIPIGSNLPIFAPITPFQMQHSAITIAMSSEAKTTSAISSTIVSSFQSNAHSIGSASMVHKRPGYRDKRSRFKSATYRELEHLDPNTIPPRVSGEFWKRHCAFLSAQFKPFRFRFNFQAFLSGGWTRIYTGPTTNSR